MEFPARSDRPENRAHVSERPARDLRRISHGLQRALEIGPGLHARCRQGRGHSRRITQTVRRALHTIQGVLHDLVDAFSVHADA